MPNGHGHKEYGGHHYPAAPHATSDCSYGCGCWMGPSRSGGPTGLSPFGKCPGNPIDGTSLGGKGDYDYVVTERISELEQRAYTAEAQLKAVEPDKLELAEQLRVAREDLYRKNNLLSELSKKIEQGLHGGMVP